MHYLACDRGGACAAFEYVAGELVVTHGADLAAPTLTNHTYADSVEFLRKHAGFGGDKNPGKTGGSLDRFVRASTAAKSAVDKPTPERLFEILDDVDQGDRTVWQIVYDPRALKVWFRSRRQRGIKVLDFSKIEHECTAPVQVLDINSSLAGDVTDQLQPYTQRANEALLARSLEEVGAAVPRVMVPMVAAYPGRMKCVASK